MDYWRIHYLGVELALATAITVALGVWVGFADGNRVANELIGGQRSAVYGTLATLDGALLGFIIATTAIVLAFAPTDRFEVLRDSDHYQTLWRTFISTIRVLGLATSVAIIALLVDRDGKTNSVVMVLCAGTTLLAAFRVARSVWALEGAIRVVTRKVPESMNAESPSQAASG
jgi:hypothetical protein